MNYIKHCNLCENKELDLNSGFICGLTNQKPAFKSTCNSINLDERFLQKIELTNIKLEKIKRSKNSIHLKFYFYIIIGFLLCTIALLVVTKYSYSGMLIYFFIYSLISIGMGFWVVAYNTLNNHRRSLKNAIIEKDEIDEFIKEYDIEYTPSIEYQEQFHNTQELKITLEFKNWKHKNSESIYQIADIPT